jgi:hypothetical protein
VPEENAESRNSAFLNPATETRLPGSANLYLWLQGLEFDISCLGVDLQQQQQ